MKHLLEHQTARPFKLGVWTDSSSAKAIMQRLGPGRSTVGKDRTHLAGQVEHAGNVADLLTKHVPRAVLDKLAGMMGYTLPGEETAKFQKYTSLNQNYRNQRVAAYEKLPTVENMDRWRMMFTALWTKRLISRQPT